MTDVQLKPTLANLNDDNLPDRITIRTTQTGVEFDISYARSETEFDAPITVKPLPGKFSTTFQPKALLFSTAEKALKVLGSDNGATQVATMSAEELTAPQTAQSETHKSYSPFDEKNDEFLRQTGLSDEMREGIKNLKTDAGPPPTSAVFTREPVGSVGPVDLPASTWETPAYTPRYAVDFGKKEPGGIGQIHDANAFDEEVNRRLAAKALPEIDARVEMRMASLQELFRELKRTSPEAENGGRVALKLTINANGTVESIAITTMGIKIDDPQIRANFEARLKDLVGAIPMPGCEEKPYYVANYPIIFATV